MTETIRNTIEIRCPPESLYAYVTQPWLWHEWHPSSESARASVPTLRVGDTFDETIVLQPLAPLPLKMRRATRYTVLDATPATLWRVKGAMHDGWLEIRYEFEPSATGTRFTRTLSYNATGISALLIPVLRGRMKSISLIALANLKQKLESGG